MFFTKSGTVFHWRLFRTYTSLFKGDKLHYRLTVTQLRVNEDKCISNNRFQLFCPSPYRCNLQYMNTGIMSKDVASHYAFILRRLSRLLHVPNPEYSWRRHRDATPCTDTRLCIAWRHQNACTVWKRLHYGHVLEMIVLVNYTEVSGTS